MEKEYTFKEKCICTGKALRFPGFLCQGTVSGFRKYFAGKPPKGESDEQIFAPNHAIRMHF